MEQKNSFNFEDLCTKKAGTLYKYLNRFKLMYNSMLYIFLKIYCTYAIYYLFLNYIKQDNA